MKIEDTFDYTISSDWRDRLVAEYLQCAIRVKKLKDALNDPVKLPTDILPIMSEQLKAMVVYKQCLEERINTCGINLSLYLEHRKETVSGVADNLGGVNKD